MSMKKCVLSGLLLLTGILLFAAEDFVIIRMVRHGQPGMRGLDFTPEMKKSWIGLGLTKTGIKQSRITGEFLKKEGRKYIVVASPQERAAETANIICGVLGTTFTLDKDLREIGNPIRETLERLRGRFKNIDPKENMLLTPEQAKGFKESGKATGLRGKKVIMKLVNSGKKGPFLLVAHGSFMNNTVREFTGKRIGPWNCGMIELKVWKNGKGELVKGAFPEVLSADLITDNQTLFHKAPWYGKFLAYKAKRPADIKFVEKEFECFRAKQNSSWRKGRGKGAHVVQNGKIVSIWTAKVPFSISSPAYPVSIIGKYAVTIKATGKGTGVMSVNGGGSKCKTVITLTPEEKEYTLHTGPHKHYKTHQIVFTARPESKFTITSFKITQLK